MEITSKVQDRIEYHIEQRHTQYIFSKFSYATRVGISITYVLLIYKNRNIEKRTIATRVTITIAPTEGDLYLAISNKGLI